MTSSAAAASGLLPPVTRPGLRPGTRPRSAPLAPRYGSQYTPRGRPRQVVGQDHDLGAVPPRIPTFTPTPVVGWLRPRGDAGCRMVMGSIVLTLPRAEPSVIDRAAPISRPPVIVSGAARGCLHDLYFRHKRRLGRSTQPEPQNRPPGVVLDTDDPQRLAEFYTALLGWEIEHPRRTGSRSATAQGPMDFQLALNHKPPTWPDNAVPNSFISTCMLTIWPRLRRTRSPSVPGAPPTAIIRPTSSSSWIRAAIRSVSAHSSAITPTDHPLQ